MRFFSRVKVFYKDKIVLFLTVLTIGLLVATWLQFLWNEVEHSPITVLHYNIYAGIDIIGQWYWLYIIPGILLALSIVNFLLALWFWAKQQVWSYILLTSSLLINAMSFIYIYNILNYSL